ncbi:MAG: PIN domain-containing protein [Nanoarchaeota archaeon]|nr:PIN domain-containing protein [Nanoarchaeota archaeon]
MSKKFFFDTYALIEIYKGNPKFEDYKEGIQMIITELNILEYIYFLIREKREDEIDRIYEKLENFCVNYQKDILKKAAKMKFLCKKDKLSFVDCIGYELAKKHNCKFLTGDEKFRNKQNVEFVKK